MLEEKNQRNNSKPHRNRQDYIIAVFDFELGEALATCGQTACKGHLHIKNACAVKTGCAGTGQNWI